MLTIYDQRVFATEDLKFSTEFSPPKFIRLLKPVARIFHPELPVKYKLVSIPSAEGGSISARQMPGAVAAQFPSRTGK
ncbi:MAG: hypothetical protein DMG08_01940 [Acidobacteria bacterium]|nr:MAG: hypothetical protein DMG08_01940 [Acidobacteriota bacterium]